MSKWIGVLNKRIETDITITGIVWREGWNQTSVKPFVKLYTMIDNEGNILTMRTAAQFKIGQKWRIEGKVKRHNHFNSQCQTHITDWSLTLQPKGMP